ncbi:hypothetical protein EON67_11025 [archaeon]|nr:MAG: hypothetical protein EON67_11025 [archaeon]
MEASLPLSAMTAMRAPRVDSKTARSRVAASAPVTPPLAPVACSVAQSPALSPQSPALRGMGG